jgi:hypothetical protein
MKGHFLCFMSLLLLMARESMSDQVNNITQVENKKDNQTDPTIIQPKGN